MLDDNYSHFVIVVVLGFNKFRKRASATDQHRSLSAFLGKGGGGGVCAQQGFVGGGSALRSNPLPLKIPFLTKQLVLLSSFHGYGFFIYLLFPFPYTV